MSESRKTIGDVRAELADSLASANQAVVGLGGAIERARIIAEREGRPELFDELCGKLRDFVPAELRGPERVIEKEVVREIVRMPDFTELARSREFWGDEVLGRLGTWLLRENGMNVLGFRAEVDSGGVVNSIGIPQKCFRPKLLVVDPACAGGELLDVMIGNCSQGVDSGSMPLSVFCPTSWTSDELMAKAAGKYDIAQVGQHITLLVSLPEPRVFRAVFLGEVVDNDEWLRQRGHGGVFGNSGPTGPAGPTGFVHRHTIPGDQ